MPRTMRTRMRRPVLITALVAAVLASGCVEKVEKVGAPAAGTVPNAGENGINNDLLATLKGGDLADGPTVSERFGGQEASFGVIPETPIQATGEPIRIGMINQEGTPLGSFPELRLANEAGIRFINAELGGVGGRPLELVSCTTTFSPEKSQACAQQMVQAGVVAVLGGIDLTSTGSMPVLEENGIPFVGGIPVNTEEMVSPVSFQFSGGMPAAAVAFAEHAVDNGAETVVIAYGDYGPVKLSAVDFGAATARALGADNVVELAFPITTTDFLPVMTAAKEADPDAIIMVVADTACAPSMQTAHDLEIDAELYLVGSCASPNIAEQVGEEVVDGRIFNIEGPLVSDGIDGSIYMAAMGKYGDPQLNAAGAGTVSFRGLVNLYSVLNELGPDAASPDRVLDAFRNARDRPSFNGFPFTCDGQQIPSMPAICSPQQVLIARRNGTLEQLTDWVDVPGILREANVAQTPPN